MRLGRLTKIARHKGEIVGVCLTLYFFAAEKEALNPTLAAHK